MAAPIIIRLQNLPWEANSQDIRRFFEGLAIPEGGVHIVGGDRGDAFIAFATDEDARQGMAKDGQEIKGIKIKLFLSSNNEMKKIVEQAREAHMNMMNRPQLPVTPVMPNPMVPVVVKPPPPPSLELVKKPAPPEVVVIKDDGPRKRSRSRSRDRRRSRSRDRKRERSRDRKRSRSRSRDRNGRGRGGRRRSRSRSRDRRDRNGRDRRRSDDTKEGTNSRDATAIIEREPVVETNDTPVWEPGMQPGVALGNAALSFMGLPALGIPANLTNLLQGMQGMQGTLPVNPLVVAQALAAQSAAAQAAAAAAMPAIPSVADLGQAARPSAVVPAAHTATSAAALAGGAVLPPVVVVAPPPSSTSSLLPSAAAQSAAVVLPTVPKIPGVKNALLPTPDPTPARKATPPPSNNLPVFPMFKNQTASAGSASAGAAGNPSSSNNNSSNNNNSNSSSSTTAAPTSGTAATSATTAATNGTGVSIETLHFKIAGVKELCNYIDVKHFFCGISLPNGSIRYSWDGHNPVVYINVKDIDDAKIVQKLDGELLGNCTLKIKPIDRMEFLKGQEFYVDTPHQMDSLRFNRPNQGLLLGGRAKPVEQDLVVVIIGIPFEVTEKDVREFLSGINVVEVFIEYNQAGQCVGHCFVKVASHNDLELALGQCGQRIKHRNVEVLVANQNIMTESKELYEKKRRSGTTTAASRPSRNHEKRPSRFSSIDDPPAVPAAPPRRYGGMEPPKTVLSIHGLPFDIIDRQIGDMCAELGVSTKSIHIKNGSNPAEPSCAFVECLSPEDAAVVAKMSGRPYYGYTLTIEAVTVEFMRSSMSAPISAPPMPPFGMPPMGPQGYDAAMMGGPFRGRGRSRGRGGGRGGHQFSMNGAMPPVGMPFPAGGPGPMGGPMGDPMAGSHNGAGGPPHAGKPSLPDLPIFSPADPFANPQCVVAISNLNYTAGVEDLINVFKDYSIRKDLIMRRYNEQNQPTGDARVAFATPQEAAEAVKRFNGTQLLGRTLRLTMLSR